MVRDDTSSGSHVGLGTASLWLEMAGANRKVEKGHWL